MLDGLAVRAEPGSGGRGARSPEEDRLGQLRFERVMDEPRRLGVFRACERIESGAVERAPPPRKDRFCDREAGNLVTEPDYAILIAQKSREKALVESRVGGSELEEEGSICA